MFADPSVMMTDGAIIVSDVCIISNWDTKNCQVFCNKMSDVAMIESDISIFLAVQPFFHEAIAAARRR